MRKKFLAVALAGLLWGSLVTVPRSEAVIAPAGLSYFSNLLMEKSAEMVERKCGNSGTKVAWVLRKMKRGTRRWFEIDIINY